MGTDEIMEQVVLYVDEGLDDAARAVFEKRLEESPELREEVQRARILRGLLSNLPRREAELPDFDVLFERIDAEPSPGLRSAIGLLKRAPAPEGLFEAVSEEMRRDRPVVVEKPVLRLDRRSRPPMIASLAAAAVLLASSMALYSSALEKHPVRAPKHPLVAKMRFEWVAEQDMPRAVPSDGDLETGGYR